MNFQRIIANLNLQIINTMEVINNIKEKTESLIEQGFQTDAGKYIRIGWEIFQKEM